MDKTSEKFNLEKRTAGFSEEAIIFAKQIKRDVVNLPMISHFSRSQLLRSQWRELEKRFQE